MVMELSKGPPAASSGQPHQPPTASAAVVDPRSRCPEGVLRTSRQPAGHSVAMNTVPTVLKLSTISIGEPTVSA
jgi:hypothetical protein